MSIATQISRLQSLRNQIRAKLTRLGLLGAPTRDGVQGGDLADCVTAVENIDEVTPYLIQSAGAKDVAAYKYAQIDATNLTAENIASGVTILGVTGTGGAPGQGNTNVNAYLGEDQSMISTRPTNYQSYYQISTPAGYDGMSTVNLVLDTDVIKPENIVRGVTILGVAGQYDFMSMKTAHNSFGEIDISENSITFTLLDPLDENSYITPQQLTDTDKIQWCNIEPKFSNNLTFGTGYEILSVQIYRNPYPSGLDYNTFQYGETIIVFNIMHSSWIGTTTYYRVYVDGSQIVFGTTDNGTKRTVKIKVGSGPVYLIDSHFGLGSNPGFDHDDIIFKTPSDTCNYHIDLKYI